MRTKPEPPPPLKLPSPTTTTTTSANNHDVRARSNSSSSAFLLSAQAFVLSPHNRGDETLFPKITDDEEEYETGWFDCLHLDCIGNRPHSTVAPSTAIAVIDFLVVIMIALAGVYFLFQDFIIGGLGTSNGRFVSFFDSFRTCFVFRQIENRKHKDGPSANSPWSSPGNATGKNDSDGEQIEDSCLSRATGMLARLFRALRIKYMVGTITSLVLSKWPVWTHSKRHVGSFLLSYIGINSQFNLIFDTLARSLLLQLILNTIGALYKFRKLNFGAYSTAEIGVDDWNVLSSLSLLLMIGEGVSLGFAYDKYSRRYSMLNAWIHATYHMFNWRVCLTVVTSITLWLSHRFSDSLTPNAKHICKCIAFLLLWMRYCATTMQSILKSKIVDPLKNIWRRFCECKETTAAGKEATATTKEMKSPSHLKQD